MAVEGFAAMASIATTQYRERVQGELNCDIHSLKAVESPACRLPVFYLQMT